MPIIAQPLSHLPLDVGLKEVVGEQPHVLLWFFIAFLSELIGSSELFVVVACGEFDG